MFSMLRDAGYKFKKHYPVLGKPDIVFPKIKVAVFIDGEFWHGKNFDLLKDKLSPFWMEKIGENIRRDKRIERGLRQKGWHIIRFWDKKVIRFPEESLTRLVRFLKRNEKFCRD